MKGGRVAKATSKKTEKKTVTSVSSHSSSPFGDSDLPGEEDASVLGSEPLD